MSTKPNLKFLASTDRMGFTSAAVGNIGEGQPAPVVRELIQNSMDASLEAKNKKAVVRFCLGSIDTDAIPGIDSYRKALEQARAHREKESGGKLAYQEHKIVTRMERALGKSKLPMLAVIDNGVGLTKKTMEDLLTDGSSNKPPGSGGAFGNGHFAVFPTSDLRYLLYAAVGGSQSIASGHTVLASRPGFSAHGYYISSANAKGKHRYPTGEQAPEFNKLALTSIQKDTGHGTAVLIPAFNSFYENSKKTTYELIAEAAACNFFPVIKEEKLIVTWEEENGKKEVLNHQTLRSVLKLFENNRHGTGFLSGYKANMSYNIMNESTHNIVSVGSEKIDVYLKYPSVDGRSRINLFRNGMWITSNDPGSGSLPASFGAFGNHASFEALVLVNAQDAPGFNELIRCAETTLHNKLKTRDLDPPKKKKMMEFFNALLVWFQRAVPEISYDPYTPDHLLSVARRGARLGESTGYHYDGFIDLETERAYRNPVPGPVPGQGPRPGSNGGSGSGSRSRSPRPISSSEFAVTIRPEEGRNKTRINIKSYGRWEDPVLHLGIDECIDPTAGSVPWPQLEVDIVSASKDSGEKLKIVKDQSPGTRTGVKIGCLEVGDEITISVVYKINGIDESSTYNPGFLVSLDSAASDLGDDR